MECTVVESPYALLLRAAISIPITHYLLGFTFIFVVFVYHFLEIHFFQDLLTGFSGQPVTFTYNPSCQLYHEVVSKCRILHQRYLSTPWLCSPHLQTAFLHFFGNPPVVNYKRHLFVASDGGTLAMDWVVNDNVEQKDGNDGVPPVDVKVPIIIILPGLTSASHSGYVKHVAFGMAKCGWNVVVSSNRGFGGVPITSDCFYNGGWTKDIREIINHLHRQYPETPIFAIGASIGANILVKYLGEDGDKVPLAGAAAVCSPWDFLIGDRHMNRNFVQRAYSKALSAGLKRYAHMHETVFARLSDWESVKKSNSIRQFDDSSTRYFGNFGTVDTFYRRASSAQYVGGVTVPLLCINALDDPVCTREAIPWDECRLNSNIVLATTEHGGHLPFFEGLTATSVWWVRAVEEYLHILQSSPLICRNDKIPISASNPLESGINKTPFVSLSGDGIVTAVGNKGEDIVTHVEVIANENQNANIDLSKDKATPVKKLLSQLSRKNNNSLWLLICVAIVTSWPVVGSPLALFFKRSY